MKKVLFLHGFFASGSCVPANALREALQGEAEVLSPDLPLRPKAAAGISNSARASSDIYI